MGVSRECLSWKGLENPKGWTWAAGLGRVWDALQGGGRGQHVCAEVKLQDWGGGSVGGCGASPSVVSVETQCGSPILGIRRGVGECRVLGPGPPTASGMGGLTPCSKNQRAGGDAYEKVQFTKGTLLKGERAAVPSPLPRPNSLLLPSELSLGFWLG